VLSVYSRSIVYKKSLKLSGAILGEPLSLEPRERR